jgi:NTP pyrophosphatase (non-canonical NTP hydrolase)
MDLKQLQQKIKDTNKHISPYKLSTIEEQEILARTVKLNEEVGELCNDILSVLKMQRKSKLESFDKRNFYEEFADVILSTLQLANAAHVDVERAVNDKMKKIEEKYRKDH